MGKRPSIRILAFLATVVLTTSGFSAGTARKLLLRDGFVLRGVDGKLTAADSNEGPQEDPDKWFFEFDSDVSDRRGRVRAGTSLELLPSAALEKMTADVKKRSGADYRLWARVTKYRGRNFIFPTDFLPLGKQVKLRPVTTQKSQEQESKPTEGPPVQEGTEEVAINEPNDVVTIPQEILEKLEPRKIGRKIAPTAQREKGLELKPDSILADRVGFILSHVMRDAHRAEEKREKGKENTQYGFFVLDALGWNVRSASGRFGLLPCESLERAEERQSEQPDPPRFKIAGIVTRYKGKQYLLLQRASRVYSYENFGI